MSTRSLLWSLAILVGLAAPAVAQTVAGDRVRLNGGPCVIRSVPDRTSGSSGTPEGNVDGNPCDLYIRNDGSTTVPTIYIKESGTSNTGWIALPATPGTVTSVTFSPPGEWTCSGSPITTSGTISCSWVSQLAHKVLIGPVSGGAATPGFRVLDDADLPFGTPARGDLLRGNSTPGWQRYAVSTTTGQFIRTDGTDPAWSTLTMPNTSATGSILVATGTNAIGSLAAVGANQVLASAGLGTVPAYTATPTVTSITASSLTAGRVPIVGTAGLVTDDADLTFAPLTNTLQSGNLASAANITTNSGNVGTDNFASQTTGWRCTYAGDCDDRYHFSSEFLAKKFVTDFEQALAGSLTVAKSVGLLTSSFACPALAGNAAITVDDLPGGLGQPVFESADTIVVQNFSRPSGIGLSIGTCRGFVDGYSDNGNGTQAWTFRRWGSTRGGDGGTITGGTTIEAKSVLMDFGQGSSAGFATINSIDGANAVNSPYFRVTTFTGDPKDNAQVVRAQFGQLKGITGTSEYGALEGVYSATNGTYLIATDQHFESHGLPLYFWDSSGASNVKVISIVPNGSDPYIGIGNPSPTTCGTTAGLILKWGSSPAKACAAFYSDANNYWKFDGSVLTWKAANTTLDASGNLTATSATLSGAITATSGAIGGFTIGSDYVRDTGNSFGLASTVTGGNDVRFWAGDTFANRATADARIYENGDAYFGNLAITSSGTKMSPDASASPNQQHGYGFDVATGLLGTYGADDGSSRNIFVESTWSGASTRPQTVQLFASDQSSDPYYAQVSAVSDSASFGTAVLMQANGPSGATNTVIRSVVANATAGDGKLELKVNNTVSELNIESDSVNFSGALGSGGTTLKFTPGSDLRLTGGTPFYLNTASSIQSSTLMHVSLPGNTKNGIAIKDTDDTGNTHLLDFLRNSGSIIGSIKTASTTSVSFNTTSDVRLKKDAGPATDFSALLALRIHDYTLRDDGKWGRGPFAQEVYTIPAYRKRNIVSPGRNDDLDNKGLPRDPWTLNYDGFIPDLIVAAQAHDAAIADLAKEIARLNAEVIALRGRIK